MRSQMAALKKANGIFFQKTESLIAWKRSSEVYLKSKIQKKNQSIGRTETI